MSSVLIFLLVVCQFVFYEQITKVAIVLALLFVAFPEILVPLWVLLGLPKLDKRR